MSGADGKKVLSVGDTDAQVTLEEACYCMNIGHFKSLQNLLMYDQAFLWNEIKWKFRSSEIYVSFRNNLIFQNKLPSKLFLTVWSSQPMLCDMVDQYRDKSKIYFNLLMGAEGESFFPNTYKARDG